MRESLTSTIVRLEKTVASLEQETAELTSELTTVKAELSREKAKSNPLTAHIYSTLPPTPAPSVSRLAEYRAITSPVERSVYWSKHESEIKNEVKEQVHVC